MLRSFFLILFTLCTLSFDAIAQWEKISTLPCRVRIIEMLDQRVGFIGTGEVPTSSPDGPVSIFKTTDGGNTWKQTNTPSNYVGVLDIFMTTPERGWAAVYKDRGPILWKTTDGGENWEEDLNINGTWGTGVYETPAAVLVCDFWGQIHSSTDKGQTWSKIKGANDAYLHFAFMDDLNGIVASYRSGGLWGVTSDGGLTWVESSKSDESWSVFADKKTRNYYASPEGHSGESFWKSKVWKSSDMGHNWDITTSLPFRSTGHLDGNNGVLYIQTNERGCSGCGDESVYKRGIYKSLDEGVNWEYIGGPDGVPDTRFEVLPVSCGGNILFVANDRDVWKFVDGSAANGIEVFAKEQPPIKGMDQEVPLALGATFDASAEVEKLLVRKITFTLKFDTSIIFVDRNRARDIFTPSTGWLLANMTKHADGLSITIVDTAAIGISSDQSFGTLRIVPQSPKGRNTSVILTKVILLDGENGLNTACIEIKQDYITNILVEQGIADVADFATPKTEMLLTPNPARTATTLTLKLRNASEVDLGIYDVQGKELFRHRSEGKINATGIYHYQLPLSGLAAGQYFVRVTADDRILVEGLTLY